MEGINLALLPPLTVVKQVNYEDILLEVAKAAEIENLSPTDPAYRIALAAAYRETLVRQEANEQAKGIMLAFAVRSQLDHIGATYYKFADGSPVLRLEGESDDNYRARLQQSPEASSVAGPEPAYILNAKSADAIIKDVALHSPDPVEIRLYVLTYEGDGTPSAELLQKIYDHLWPLRPLSDHVVMKPAKLINYSVTANLIIKRGSDGEVIKAAALKFAQVYVELKRSLGAWVVESGLHAAITVENVEKVNLENWTDLICPFDTAPNCENINIEIAGYV